jgi:hypothetical protein
MSPPPDEQATNAPHGPAERGDPVRARAKVVNGVLLVTGRRVALTDDAGESTLDVPFIGIRRIEFNIDRERPATVVIVPEHRTDPLIALEVASDQYAAVAEALAVLGRDLADTPLVAPEGEDDEAS